MHTAFTPWMNFLHVQMICIADLYDCVNSYTVIILDVLYALYVFDMFHVLLSGDSLRDLWIVCMYVCLYVCLCMYVRMLVCVYICMYVFMYVCMYVYMYVCTYVLCMYVCIMYV